jgi:hypothetical protein
LESFIAGERKGLRLDSFHVSKRDEASDWIISMGLMRDEALIGSFSSLWESRPLKLKIFMAGERSLTDSFHVLKRNEASDWIVFHVLMKEEASDCIVFISDERGGLWLDSFHVWWDRMPL